VEFKYGKNEYSTKAQKKSRIGELEWDGIFAESNK
jgi:hypothetical protein